MTQNVVIDNKEYTPEELATLAKAGVLNVGQKHDTSSTTPNNVPLNGPFPNSTTTFGTFSGAGYRPGIWNATPRVRSFADAIPMFRSEFYNELIEVATGVTAGTGNNQTAACSVGPKPGALKSARITAPFGMIHMSTNIFDITQVGMRRNRADIDRELFNQALTMNNWLPNVPGIQGDGGYWTALRAELYALGIELERNISRVHFTGVSGTSDNTYRGVATQWNGLDQLIREGWTDATSGVAVPALDAEVVSFNAAIDGGLDGFSRTVIAAFTDTYFGQVDMLRRLGITPEFALVMRPDLFRALAAVWSCGYSVTRCVSSAAGQPLVRDAVSTRAEYESILAGQYLPMDGVNVPVLLDDTITRETLGNGHYKSDVYGVALRGNGRPVVYGEFFDMGNPQAMEVANFLSTGASQVLNGGLYRAFRRETGGCLEFDFVARPRLITDAPFAHFRIDDLQYRSYYDQRDAIPGQSFYVNGGHSYR
jgi:hypothetical protein